MTNYIRSIICLISSVFLNIQIVNAQQHYALIVSGYATKDLELQSNKISSRQLWQKTFSVWEGLIQQNIYKNDQIKVLFDNGQDWSDPDPLLKNEKYSAGSYGLIKITNLPSDTSSLSTIISILEKTIENKDLLIVFFVYLSDEENTSSCCDLTLSSGSILTENLLSKLKKIVPFCEVVYVPVFIHSTGSDFTTN